MESCKFTICSQWIIHRVNAAMGDSPPPTQGQTERWQNATTTSGRCGGLRAQCHSAGVSARSLGLLGSVLFKQP